MTKRDIAVAVAERQGLTVGQTLPIIQGAFDAIRDELVQGRRLELRGLAVFEPVVRPARTRWNPLTRQPVQGQERLDVRVTVSGEITGAMSPADQWPKAKDRPKRQPWWDRGKGDPDEG